MIMFFVTFAIIIAITVAPVMFAARLVGAKNTGFGAALWRSFFWDYYPLQSISFFRASLKQLPSLHRRFWVRQSYRLSSAQRFFAASP